MLARSQMLYEYWSAIARERPDESALRHPDLPGEGTVWTFSDIDQRVRELKCDTSSAKFITAYGDHLDFIPSILAAWKNKIPVLILESQNTEAMPIQTDIPAGTALIKQTCGASGIERSLFFGEAQVLAEGLRNCQSLGLTTEYRSIAAISLAHSYGFGCLALPLLLKGIPIDVLPSPLPVFVQQALANEGQFFLPAVPALWKTWWLTKTLDGSSIRLALSAGAPLSLELESNIWNDTGIKLHNFYGTTETGAIAFDGSSSPRTEPGFIGTILPGIDVQVAENNRICVHTDARAIGADSYISETEFNGSHYQTMDLGALHEGFLHWHDHVGDAINVAGRKVSPEKIKRICLSCPGVIDATVSSTRSRDFERFEEVSVSLKLSPGQELKQVKTLVYENLDSWEVPRHWHIST